MLRAMGDRLTGQIHALRDDSLHRNDPIVANEDGTAVYDVQFSLNLVNSENEAVLAIDEALHRLDEGTYGKCEECGCLIEIARLKALPFASTCIRCQSELEKGRGRRRL